MGRLSGPTLITVGKVFTNFHFLSLKSDLTSCHVAAHQSTKSTKHYYQASIWCGWSESGAVSLWWHSYLDWSVLTWRMQNNWRNNDQLLTNTPEDSHNYLLPGVKQLSWSTNWKLENRFSKGRRGFQHEIKPICFLYPINCIPIYRCILLLQRW